MNILLINDFLYGGGAEVIFTKLHETLTSLGHNVDVFFGEEKPILSKSVIDYIYNRHSAKSLKQLFVRNHYNYVIVLNYASSLSPSVLHIIKKYKLIQHFKVIYNAHDAHIICPNSGMNFFEHGKMFRLKECSRMTQFLFKRLDHRGFHYSLLKKIQWVHAYRIRGFHKVFDLVISPSNFLLNRIKSFYPEFKCEIVRNPCLDDLPQSLDTKNVNQPVKLVFIGRLSNEKGIIPFLESLKQVNLDYTFDIYGDGPLKEEMNIWIDRNALSSRIELKGIKAHRDMMNILKNYDAIVLPSIMFENAPLSIIEASSQNLFILTMGYGGMKELAQLVGNYYFIDPISPVKIACAIDYVRKAQFIQPDLSEFTSKRYKERISSLIV